MVASLFCCWLVVKNRSLRYDAGTLINETPSHMAFAIRYRKQASVLMSVLALGSPSLVDASTCYGSAANGRLSGGVQLPVHGANFEAYSLVGPNLGRTYVHDLALQVMLDAYADAGKALPAKHYVYGETGFAHGGRIRPHRTHQAGLSVDFMVPVLDNANRSVSLPSTPMNKFGYGLEFDDKGRIPGFRIDFDAMAEHLFQISKASQQHAIAIAIERVIFDPRLMDKLLSSRHGAELRRSIPFMKTRPWVRHDEHYHIDFRIPCRPLGEYRGR